MNPSLQSIVTELDLVAGFIRQQLSERITLKENFGWNHPPLTRDDLASRASGIAQKLRDLNIDQISDSQRLLADDLARKIALFRADTIQYMFNGHGVTAVPLYYLLMDHIDERLSIFDGWTGLKAIYSKHAEYTKQVGQLKERLTRLDKEFSNLDDKARDINSAREAAESLPATLEDLKAAAIDTNTLRESAKNNFDRTKEILSEMAKAKQSLEETRIQAEDIIKKAASAHSAATATALSESFYERSKQLHRSLQYWVLGLILALAATAALGVFRFSNLAETLKTPNLAWYVIITEILLTVVSLGVPLWFAWIASRQIVYSFKLAEDYAFKASVSRAYEGYRIEALKYDKAFAQRLLSTALTRLDEEPLRLIDKENHSSPMSEAASSSFGKNILTAATKTLGVANTRKLEASTKDETSSEA